MKTLKTFLTTAMILTGIIGYSQDYAFRVMVSKGANEVKTGGEWKALKTGAQLNDTDELKVSENAYLGLMHSGGRTLEWKNAGTFKVSELAGKVSEGSNDFSHYKLRTTVITGGRGLRPARADLVIN